MPTTPTRSVARMSFWTIGLKTVIPPQNSGPALAASSAVGQRRRPHRLGPNPVGEAAVAADHGRLRGRTEVVVAGHALVAVHAGAGEPAEPHRLPGVQVADVLAHRRDRADDLVAGDERVGRHLPVVVEHAEVAVADAAIAHVDVDLVVAERAQRVLERRQRAAGGGRGVGLDGGFAAHAQPSTVTTILPNCSPASMYRCASTICSSGKVLAMIGFSAPFASPPRTKLLPRAKRSGSLTISNRV